MTDTASRLQIVSLLVIVFVVAALPRVFDLGVFISPDEPRWHRNTLGFVEGLQEGDFGKFYQQPHPGITTQWLAAPTVHSDSWAYRKLPLAAALAALVAVAALLMLRLWGWGVAVVAGLLLAINPHFVAHSRVLAMDALLSVFLLISLLALLLWLRTHYYHWLVLSGVAGALALLSKIIGGVIVPYALLVILGHFVRRWSLASFMKMAAVWLASFLLTIIIVFPTVLTHPTLVLAGTQEFFATEHYSQAVHALGPLWYPEAVLVWSTPLHLLAVLLSSLMLLVSQRIRREFILLGGFALIFFLVVQYSVKKGDRYLLPDFLVFDVLTALVLVRGGTSFLKRFGIFALHRHVFVGTLLLFIGVIVWQMWDVARLHPYYLAYRNPFFREIARGRTMGWGEGLDLAAHYLNAKPDPASILVAAYYEGQFGYRFKGEFTSVERLARETVEDIGADYVVLYRAMQHRAPERWETNVLEQFKDQQPEHVVVLNGEEYVWVYRVGEEETRR